MSTYACVCVCDTTGNNDERAGEEPTIQQTPHSADLQVNAAGIRGFLLDTCALTQVDGVIVAHLFGRGNKVAACPCGRPFPDRSLIREKVVNSVSCRLNC